jgi:hypothetical protein
MFQPRILGLAVAGLLALAPAPAGAGLVLDNPGVVRTHTGRLVLDGMGNALVGECVLATVESSPLFGPNRFVGTVAGFILDRTSSSAHTLRCFVRVNGVDAGAGTFPVTGGPLATAVNPTASFFANDFDSVALCAQWRGFERCGDTSAAQVPPQEIVDLLDAVVEATRIVDPVACPALVALAPGVPGLVDIAPSGDVYLFGGWTWTWDCPPYDV